MKAFLLSAGYGTRLKPLTDNLPKCLVPIAGKPLLYYWLDTLEKENIEEVLINIHYLSETVIKKINERKNHIKIHFSYEKKLLGSAGTVFSNKGFLNNDTDFLIIYSDNYAQISLKPLIKFHKSNNSIYTCYVYETDKPQMKGIYEYDKKTGRAVSFEEKPINPKSKMANSGIAVLNKRIFSLDKGIIPCDLGKDILPKIVNETFLLKSEKPIIDIGNYDDYNYVNNLNS